MIKKLKKRWLMFCMLFLLCPTEALASSTVMVRATIFISACTINDGIPIEVDFGNISTGRINGVNYAKPVNFTMSCGELPSPGLKLQVSGNEANFDATSLRTSIDDLGVAFIDAAGKRLALNIGWQNFSYPTLPTLIVVPVMRAGAKLSPGGFSATATLIVEQQ